MRLSIGLVLIIGAMLPSAAKAQAVCNHPQSCAKLHCQKTCVDTWDNGVCVGGYCPQGFTAQRAAESGQKDMVIHNASPSLQKKIRDLLDSGQ